MRVENGFSNKYAPVSQPTERLLEEIPLDNDMKMVLSVLAIHRWKGEVGDNAVVEQTKDCRGTHKTSMELLCLEITELKLDDEVTRNRDAYSTWRAFWRFGSLARYYKMLAEKHKNHLGYQFMLDFDYEALPPLQRFLIDNVGDPLIEGNVGLHSRQGVMD